LGISDVICDKSPSISGIKRGIRKDQQNIEKTGYPDTVISDTKSLVAGYYPRIARDLLKPLLSLFSHCLDACDCDITKFMVMLVVAVRTTMHRDFGTFTPEQLISGEIPIFPCLPVSVRSVAEILGLPKETIRRKVTELADAGWLVREHGRLYFTAAAYQQLSPVREQIEDLAARYYEVVAALKSDTMLG
jgi:DNA-binding transcriptional regulator YhcF (GntR family)